MAAVDVATHILQQRSASQATCAANQASYKHIKRFGKVEVEAALDALEFWVDGTSTSDVAQFVKRTALQAGSAKDTKYLMSVYSKCTIVNNDSVPGWVDFYKFVPKDTTHEMPDATRYSHGLNDLAVTGGSNLPTATSVFYYPSKSKDIMDKWDMSKHTKICLAPGESKSFITPLTSRTMKVNKTILLMTISKHLVLMSTLFVWKDALGILYLHLHK